MVFAVPFAVTYTLTGIKGGAISHVTARAGRSAKKLRKCSICWAKTTASSASRAIRFGRRRRAEKPHVSAFISAEVPKILALEPNLVLTFSDLQAESSR